MTMRTAGRAGTRTTPAPTGPLTHRQILAIITALLLGMFLAALDQTVVSTSIRRIGDDLHGLSAQAWVTTAFLITSTITTPLYGKLSDIFGRKQLFMIAISIFVSGSALCGLATDMYMLAGFRALQGLGAGGLVSVAMAITADILSPQERPRYMGYFMATFATSSVLGPLVGGFFSGQDAILGIAGWRWIFWINVPIGIVALIVVNRVLRMPTRRAQQVRIDSWGTVAIVTAVVPLLLVAERGREWGWTSAWSLGCFVLGAVGLVAFLLAERRMGDDALIPLRLFRNRTFSLGSAISMVLGIGMFGGLAAIPLYLQIVKGASPTRAGLLMLPLMLGMMGASLAAGRWTSRTGHYRKFPIVGSFLLVAALVLLSFLGADTPLWKADVYMLMFGVGLGLNMQTIQLAMQNAVSPRDIGVATASGTFFRQMGGTLGTAVFLSILFGGAPAKISDAYQTAAGDPGFAAAAAAHPDQLRQITSSTSLNDTAFLQSIEKTLTHPFMVGFSDAMGLVFIVGAAVVVIGLVLAFFVREIPLRTVSGIEAARADAAALTDAVRGPEHRVGGRAS
ncbi:MFS transporter [Frankia sp. AiPs1]|uniref:MDR family MFS transporter n=1 Tax=Frankia sp. AiPa1 TaxID=573492 RepID=UPI00202AED63|nr:MDR family MFS transporter [Frankia sp. AiPa1]MCL9759792.1 MFS transporter [Frankia sp. AiPa1]